MKQTIAFLTTLCFVLNVNVRSAEAGAVKNVMRLLLWFGGAVTKEIAVDSAANAIRNPRSANASEVSKDLSEEELAKFPLPKCGSALSNNFTDYPANFYPVFVEYSEENLRNIKTHLCQDAFVNDRTGYRQIQIASFSNRKLAFLFAEQIHDLFDNARVGNTTTVQYSNK